MKIRNLVLLVLCLGFVPLSAPAAEWGGLRGRFVVEGEPPKLPAPKVTKDKFCIDCKPVDQTVKVGKDGALANAVVWVRKPRGAELPLPAGDKQKLSREVRLANKLCVFTPHITLLRTGQTLIVANEDPTGHNTKFDLIQNPAFNQLIAAKSSVSKSFDVAESKPLPVSCNIHPFMRGYVLLRDDPYMAVSDAEGRFEINPLPVGGHVFQLWHETGYLKNLSLRQGEVDRRGRIALTISAEETLDVGDITVPAELLAD